MKYNIIFLFFIQTCLSMHMRRHTEHLPMDIDNSWIRVPWDTGDYYYYNTLTKENSDDIPDCLTGLCNWKWESPQCDNK